MVESFKAEVQHFGKHAYVLSGGFFISVIFHDLNLLLFLVLNYSTFNIFEFWTVDQIKQDV